MKILIIGCGAVGLGIAASLYDAGENPDMIAQGETYATIKNGGIARQGIFRDITVPKERIRVFESVYESNMRRTLKAINEPIDSNKMALFPGGHYNAHASTACGALL